jgi:ribosomal protein S12 methylthiotransferase
MQHFANGFPMGSPVPTVTRSAADDKGAAVDRAGGRTIHLRGLGCAKNRVDSERMLGLARRLGLTPVADAAEAEVIVVNTSGFILPAKEESIETLIELARQKQEGRCRLLIMAGCLSQRYPDELATELPEVDHFIGTADLSRLEALLSGGATARLAVGDPGRARGDEEASYERLLEDGAHSAYLKIAEGCDRPCAFCIIPRLRGPQRSRSLGSLLEEATALAESGVRELILCAQDTTAFGRDLAPPATLASLLEALDAVPGLRWIRILYAYPSSVDQPLLEAIASLPRVVPYLDLPFQHLDDEVLRRMRRGYGEARVRSTLEALRTAIPGIFLRGTLLSGHPGESELAHRALCRFVSEAELDHLGVFPFSPEEGTDAASQPDQVPEELARERAGELLELQRGVSRERLRRLRGRELEVLVERQSEESEYLREGRHRGQAPEIDGLVYLADCEAAPGQLLRVKVEGSADYDLVARPLREGDPGD